jgi:Protein of unknown function (DUF3352)
VPTLADLRYAIRRRTRRARFVAEDVAYAVRRRTRATPNGPFERWSGLPQRTRRLILAGAAAVVLVVVIALIAVPNLPCEAPGGDECAPPDDAIELVPGDSLAYLHADTDPDTQQYENAAAIAERLPKLTDQLIDRLPGPTGGTVSYRREVAPWLGDEAAVAVIPVRSGNQGVTALLEIGDEEGANRFVQDLTGGGQRTVSYRDHELGTRGELTVATAGDFVVAGPDAAVKRVIDTDGGGRSLADSEAADEVRDALPDLRLAELIVSEQGADELLAPGGSLASFEAFVNARATLGAGAALVATEDGFEIEIHSTLDPERAANAPGFFAAFPSFEPELEGSVSEGALAYLALGDPAQSLAGLLSQATAEAPGIAAGFERVAQGLRRSGNVNLERDILPLLTSQAAVAVEPSAGGSDAVVSGAPFVSLIVEEVDPEAATKALSELQAPLAKALEPQRGLQAPVFKEQEIEGVHVQSLRISPTVELTYAIVDGKLVLSTDPTGVRQVASGSSSLEDSERFSIATEELPDEVSALLYLNLSGLLGVAEQAGLGEDPAYALFSGELRKLEALAVAVERTEDAIDTKIRVTVGE